MASQYRLKRGPVIGLLVLVGVIGALLLARSSTRPVVDVYDALTVPDAYAGTTYAFDGLVCLRASSVGASVSGSGTGRGTRIGLRPAGVPLAVAYPVQDDALDDLEGSDIAAGDQRCTRLLVTPDAQGDQHASEVRVSFRYGPFGLLRSSQTVTPPLTLQVTGTGTDPRTAAGQSG